MMMKTMMNGGQDPKKRSDEVLEGGSASHPEGKVVTGRRTDWKHQVIPKRDTQL